jgi:hypothetical protein
MITRLGKVAVGSYVTVLRYGERYKVISNSVVQNRITIICKRLYDNHCLNIHSTTRVWVKPKPKIKLKANHGIHSSN